MHLFPNTTLIINNILIQLAGGSLNKLIFIGLLYSTLALYAFILSKIKNSQRVGSLEKRKGSSFKSEELDRYARHIILKEIGGSGQKKLKNARVLVVGAGGLGSPVLQYLGACGVGVIGIIDNDLVDNSNLHRQVIYPDSAIGENKVFAAAEVIKSQNPFIEVLTFNRLFNETIAKELISGISFHCLRNSVFDHIPAFTVGSRDITRLLPEVFTFYRIAFGNFIKI